MIVLAGALNDYYGRRRVFGLGLLAFGATSLLCGLAPSMERLVLFRVLQGAAGAVLVPGALALIATAYEGEEEGHAFGVWAGASAGATILGPFVGGVLAASAGLLIVGAVINAPAPDSTGEPEWPLA